MYEYLKVGEQVTFHGLLDIKLTIVEVIEATGIVRCKYYDDNLRQYIKLTVPADSLTVCRKDRPKRVLVPASKVSVVR